MTVANLHLTLAPPTHFIYAQPAAVTTLTWAKFPVADPEGNLLLDQPTPYLISGGVDPTIVLHDLRDASAQVMMDKYLRCESVQLLCSFHAYPLAFSHFVDGMARHARLSNHAG